MKTSQVLDIARVLLPTALLEKHVGECTFAAKDQPVGVVHTRVGVILSRVLKCAI